MAGSDKRRGRAESFDLPSALWPPDYRAETKSKRLLSAESATDLDLAPLVQALTGGDERRRQFVTRVVTDLSADDAVILYRIETIENLLEDPDLRARLAALLPRLGALERESRPPAFAFEWSVGRIAQRLSELELYVDVALELQEALAHTSPRARALRAIQQTLEALTASEDFRAMQRELPELRSRIDRVRGVTIGVNLSRDLRPESAVILSFDTERVEGRAGLLERLLGRDIAQRGVTKLHGETGGPSLRSFFPPLEPDRHGHFNPFVRDLQRLLQSVMAPVGEAIERYVWARARQLTVLESELSLLLNGAELIERLRSAGLPVCRPAILPMKQRACDLEDAYNVSLALRMMGANGRDGAAEIVTSRIMFGEPCAQIWILTGPNRGGKTTYTRAVALAQIMFQAGLYVPARSARMSRVDAIYTHFPRLERATPGEGRLDDEAKRLAEIFREATPDSLILLNEVLSGTSTIEGLALAHDAVLGLRLLGARAIYVTHLHDLALQINRMNTTGPAGSPIGSLVAEVQDATMGTVHRRTFRIRPGPPRGVSYASEIAEQHGISYRQIMDLLRERGIVSEL